MAGELDATSCLLNVVVKPPRCLVFAEHTIPLMGKRPVLSRHMSENVLATQWYYEKWENSLAMTENNWESLARDCNSD